MAVFRRKLAVAVHTFCCEIAWARAIHPSSWITLCAWYWVVLYATPRGKRKGTAMAQPSPQEGTTMPYRIGLVQYSYKQRLATEKANGTRRGGQSVKTIEDYTLHARQLLCYFGGLSRIIHLVDKMSLYVLSIHVTMLPSRHHWRVHHFNHQPVSHC